MNILFPLLSWKKVAKWTLFASFIAGLCFQTQVPAEWQRPLQPSLSGGELVCLSVHPLEASKFLVANRSQLFEGTGTKDWKTLWSDSGRSAGIKNILTFPWIREHIFLVTSEKILMGRPGDRSWRTIYDSGNREERRPLSFAATPQDANEWYVGTPKGLWVSRDVGRTWSRADIFSGTGAITVLFTQGNKFFIGDENCLYLSTNGSPVREVFSLPRKETGLSDAEAVETELAEEASYYIQRIRSLIADETDPRHLFLGTQAGAFESLDGGYQWRLLSRSGMQSAEILSLAYASKMRLLFAATPRGIYQYQKKDDRWKILSEGIALPYSKSIAVVKNEKLIAITGDGFTEYRITPEVNLPIEIFEPSMEMVALFRELIELEPTAREVHKKVIRYADVGNGKIKRWHIASRLAGLLPSFSFGKDYSVSNNIDLDRGGTNDPDKFIAGPYDSSKGWDADVSWRLGDIIYSSDQTSIDSREKLMVDLRQDLLSEATRVYFERRRLQIDVVYSPSLSEQEHLERLLRLDELTALLDGMTDGFLSKKLEVIYEKNPRLASLWSCAQDGVRGTEYGANQKQEEEK